MTLPADDAVRHAQRLLAIDSSNPGSTEEQAVAYVADVLDAHAIPYEVVEAAPGRCSLVARQRGSDPALPALVVHAHLDVVPAGDTPWTHDPFGGEIVDGMLWGRGAVDMKASAAMILAAQTALASGDGPRRDLIFAFFADEEAGGSLGSEWVVKHRPELFAGATQAIGELGGFTVTLADGQRLYPVQVAEKGLIWARMTLRGRAGHAAFADHGNITVQLGDLINRIAALQTDDPAPEAASTLMQEMARTLGVEPGARDEIYAALGSFGDAIRKADSTTFVPTVTGAGVKVNMIPDHGELYVDCRFVPGGAERAMAALEGAMDASTTMQLVATTPGVSGGVDDAFLEACARAIRTEDPEGRVVPFVQAGYTDGQHLAALGIRPFGFLPYFYDRDFDYLSMFHAVDERVPVESVRRGARALHAFLGEY